MRGYRKAAYFIWQCHVLLPFQIIIVNFFTNAFHVTSLDWDQWMWSLFLGFSELLWAQLIFTIPKCIIPRQMRCCSTGVSTQGEGCCERLTLIRGCSRVRRQVHKLYARSERLSSNTTRFGDMTINCTREIVGEMETRVRDSWWMHSISFHFPFSDLLFSWGFYFYLLWGDCGQPSPLKCGEIDDSLTAAVSDNACRTHSDGKFVVTKCNALQPRDQSFPAQPISIRQKAQSRTESPHTFAHRANSSTKCVCHGW